MTTNEAWAIEAKRLAEEIANNPIVGWLPSKARTDTILAILTTAKLQPAEQPPTATETGDPRYLALLADMAALHRRKAADYGRGEDPLVNIRASAEIGVPAWQGAFLRALDKVHRIKSYCLTGKLANEGVEDSMADLMAYAGIMLVLFREDREREKGAAKDG